MLQNVTTSVCGESWSPRAEDLVFEVGVDDLARLLVEEGHQATQAHTQPVDDAPAIWWTSSDSVAVQPDSRN